MEVFYDSNSRVRCPNWCEPWGRTVGAEDLRGLNWDTDRVTICWYYDLHIYVQHCLIWLRRHHQRCRWICERCAAYSVFEEAELRRCHGCGAHHQWLTRVTWDRDGLASA